MRLRESRTLQCWGFEQQISSSFALALLYTAARYPGFLFHCALRRAPWLVCLFVGVSVVFLWVFATSRPILLPDPAPRAGKDERKKSCSLSPLQRTLPHSSKATRQAYNRPHSCTTSSVDGSVSLCVSERNFVLFKHKRKRAYKILSCKRHLASEQTRPAPPRLCLHSFSFLPPPPFSFGTLPSKTENQSCSAFSSRLVILVSNLTDTE